MSNFNLYPTGEIERNLKNSFNPNLSFFSEENIALRFEKTKRLMLIKHIINEFEKSNLNELKCYAENIADTVLVTNKEHRINELLFYLKGNYTLFRSTGNYIIETNFDDIIKKA